MKMTKSSLIRECPTDNCWCWRDLYMVKRNLYCTDLKVVVPSNLEIAIEKGLTRR